MNFQAVAMLDKPFAYLEQQEALQAGRKGIDPEDNDTVSRLPLQIACKKSARCSIVRIACVLREMLMQADMALVLRKCIVSMFLAPLKSEVFRS